MMTSSTDFGLFLESKLDDDALNALNMIIVMLSSLIKEYGGLDDVTTEFNRMKENFNYNADRILEELRKKHG